MCKFNHNNIGATVSGFVRIKRGKEKDLQAALAMVGPVTIAIDHRHAAFRVSITFIIREDNLISFSFIVMEFLM